MKLISPLIILRVFGTVCISGIIATGILITQSGRSVEPAFREGFFQVISIITTTDFANADYLLWPPSGIFLIFMLLFAGACTGSTTGSIKMARHLVVIKNIKAIFKKLIHLNVVTQIKLNRIPVPGGHGAWGMEPGTKIC